MTSSITETPFLEASLESVIRRWQATDEGQRLGGGLDAEEIAARLKRRADAVRRYCDLPRRKPLNSLRKWRAEWTPEEAWHLIAGALERLGWTSRLVEGDSFAPELLASAQPGEEDVALVEKWIAERQAQRFRDAGLLVRFGWKDAAVQLLCDELYDIAAMKMGRAPALPWLDEYARHPFCREVLGWPFSPWAVELLEAD